MIEQAAAQANPKDVVLEVRAELDVPGETGRQARVFAVWVACLLLAVVVGSFFGARGATSAWDSPEALKEIAHGRALRTKVGLVLGLFLPAVVSFAITRRRRRGGSHARGIVVDVTADGELRLWGRGYGSRLSLSGASVTERLVDVYAGRLGSWRQRRLRIRSKVPTGATSHEIEFATLATSADAATLRVEGGEGDCVELRREDFERVRRKILELTTAGMS